MKDEYLIRKKELRKNEEELREIEMDIRDYTINMADAEAMHDYAAFNMFRVTVRAFQRKRDRVKSHVDALIRLLGEWDVIMQTDEFETERVKQIRFKNELDLASRLVPDDIAHQFSIPSKEVKEKAMAAYDLNENGKRHAQENPVYVIMRSSFPGFFWVCDKNAVFYGYRIKAIHEDFLLPFEGK